MDIYFKKDFIIFDTDNLLRAYEFGRIASKIESCFVDYESKQGEEKDRIQLKVYSKDLFIYLLNSKPL